ncbi:hypothetical protein KUTeg_019759, partial [Tegillarca granosa]
MNGTFKIVRKPFVQLFSIDVFPKSGDGTKQVPVTVYMMSSRTKKDYKKISKNLLKLIPRSPIVKEFVVDFEIGTWRAIQSVFPSAKIKGCAFHCGQAIWQHVRSLGLQVRISNTVSFVSTFLSYTYEYIVPLQEQYKQLDSVYKFIG